MNKEILNPLTIDLEDWYQLTGWVFDKPSAPIAELLERQVHRLLELLAKHNCAATFFTLGKSLVDCPHVVREIAGAGHEIASHGWDHQRISQKGLAHFRDDLRKSLDWLQQLTGKPVLGYRAPCFSVTAEQLPEFFEICLDAGLWYDSSVYPFGGRLYGIKSAPRKPYVALDKGDQRLVEFPIATVERWGRRWPMAGGGSWRLLPTGIIRSAIARCNREGTPAVVYFHPYEFDTDMLSVRRAVGPGLRSAMWTAHQNLGRRGLYHKLDKFLGEFSFGTMQEALLRIKRDLAL